MVLIIGGAYQGKSAYAKEHFSESEVIYDFHNKVLEMLKNYVNPVEYIKENLQNYKDKVIICDDISCSVVPTDEQLRKWRESLGHTLAIIAKESEQVIRVFCGIGTRIK